MKLYIANATKQNQIFNYRVPEMRGLPRSLPIPIGQQRPIPFELTQGQLDKIIEDGGRYGLRDYRELDRERGYVCLMFGVDKPVPAATIERVTRHNEGIQIMRGKTTREEAAVASNNLLEDSLREQGGNKGVQNFDTSVEEVQSPLNPNPTFAEGYSTDPKKTVEAPARRGRRK